MTDPVETAAPVADAAPAAEAQTPVERAVARMEGKFSGDAPAPEGEPAPVEGQPPEDGFDLPTLESLQATAEQRATERAERERLQAPLTELRTHIDQQLQGVQSVPLLRQQLQTAPHDALAALGLDPAAVGALLGKSQEPPDPVDALERLLDRKFAERDAAQKQVQAPVAPSAAPPLPEAEAIFSEYVAGAGDRFPKLAALPSNLRSGVALRYLEQARALGHDTPSWTDEQIARAVERELSSGTPPSTTGAQASSSGTTATANGGPTTSAPRSLTNGHAAQGTRPAPRTYGERRTNLIARLEAKHGGQ